MDRGLRIGAPDRRHPRPPDAPRPHPRDERRELQATREPKAQSLNPIHAVRLELAFGQCALARVRYLGTTRAKARVRPDQWELSRRCIDQSCSGIDSRLVSYGDLNQKIDRALRRLSAQWSAEKTRALNVC